MRPPLWLLFVVGLGFSSVFAQGPTHTEPVDDQIKVSPADWPWWRGPQRNGVANPDQQPPTEWSETKNVIWKAPIPGGGQSSPTIVGDHIYLATGDEKSGSQSVICFDRNTGNQLWLTEIHSSGGMRKHRKASIAASTVACDGERLFVTFANNDAVFATALTCQGKQLWQIKLSDYQVHQGYGSSPALYQSLVIVSADSPIESAVAGLDRKTGKIVWTRQRPPTPNYSSPIILHAAGQDQLLLIGCDIVSSYDPLTGETLWEIDGATTECVASTVTDGQHVFSSGGYPKNHLAAIQADGSGKVVWENNSRVYVPSMIVHDGYLYAVLDAGVAACWKSDTGQEQWKARLGGDFSASPVLVGDRMYATNEIGETYVFRVTPEACTQLATNQLGDQTYASPAICGGRIYLRTTHNTDKGRQEFLYCLGEK